jgi:hypothetical protein
MDRTTRFLAAAVVLGLFLAAPVSPEVSDKATAPATLRKSTPPEAVKIVVPATPPKILPFKPIPNKTIPAFALTGKAGKPVSRRKGALDPAQMGKVFKGMTFGGRPPAPPPPAPPTPDCSCSVTMGLSMSRPDNVFFTDDALTASYAIDCATNASIGETEYSDYRAALAAAEGGYAIDSGGSAIVYSNTSPQWAGIVSGSRSMAGKPPGVYRWYVGAANGLNGSRCSQTLAFQLINRPGTTPACADYDDCIAAMTQHIKPRINAGITNNAVLDTQVEAFRDGVYDRHVIGLRLEQDVLSPANITCTTCGPGTRYAGGVVTLDFARRRTRRTTRFSTSSSTAPGSTSASSRRTRVGGWRLRPDRRSRKWPRRWPARRSTRSAPAFSTSHPDLDFPLHFS